MRIPLLGKIIFGSESKRDSKREVIIVLTSVVTEISDQKRKRLADGERYFDPR
jgi:type II secretory pathway component GspD/PulD (secretin)